jgi:hypothetical protein
MQINSRNELKISFKSASGLRPIRPTASRVLVLWLVIFPLVYYLVQFETRYRYPILWLTWLLAAYFVTAWISRDVSFPSTDDGLVDVQDEAISDELSLQTLQLSSCKAC